MNLINIWYNNNRQNGKNNRDDNKNTLSPLGVGLIIGFLILIFINSFHFLIFSV